MMRFGANSKMCYNISAETNGKRGVLLLNVIANHNIVLWAKRPLCVDSRPAVRLSNDGKHMEGALPVPPKTPNDYHLLASARGFRWLGPEVGTVKTPTQWECEKGHRWIALYSNIKMGRGCPKCATQRQRLTPGSYHELAKERGFIWLGSEVSNARTNTGWKCEKGHCWRAAHNDIKSGRGCPTCNESKGEQAIAKALHKLGLSYEREKKFDDCRDVNPLPFDFYFVSSGLSFLVEFDGRHHYVPIEPWGGKNNLARVRRNDEIKSAFAKKQGFILIRVPYTIEDVEGFLLRKINKYTSSESQ